MAGLNYNGSHHIRMGDRVRVTGYSIEYNGKSNINERHNKNIAMDFTVSLIEANYGLPAPDLVTLAMVMDIDDGDPNTHEDIFDQSRLSGGEYFQGRLVRINNVSFTNPSLWEPGAMMEITDGTRKLPCRLGMSDVFSDPSDLGDTFDVIGIFNQEGGYTHGYQIWVMGYDNSNDLLGVVPEPASLLLLTLGSLAIFRRPRKSR